ncbi:MAG: PD-(D/E)XK nuclease family protein, partial [Candidatus Hydrogenedentes bacterium]|nr:PD-(D/E)XK nuclease family protein [Candidatus Hydrogenedentota bacterium]
GFHELQEVMDLRNLLRVVVEPLDEMAVLGLLRSPLVGLSDNAFVALCSPAGEAGAARTLSAALAGADAEDEAGLDVEDAQRLRQARELVADLRAHAELPLPAFLRRVLIRSGCESILLAQDFLGVQKALNARKVADLAERFTGAAASRLAAFVRYLDDIAAGGIREGDAPMQVEGAQSVTLMTIHKSKGLEFPVVALPDLARKPKASRAEDLLLDRELGPALRITGPDGASVEREIRYLVARRDAELDAAEHARILYVAMTRARDWLLLAGAVGTKGTAGSWFGYLDGHWDLAGRRDGDTLEGAGWRAVVRREAARLEPGDGAAAERGEPSDEVVAARIAPVQPAGSAKTTFSVTELLPVMAKESDTAGPAGVAAAPVDEGLDARLRGTLVHRLFEKWGFGPGGRPDVAGLVRRECADGRHWDAATAALTAIADRFAETEVFELLATQRAIRRETPFLLRVGDALVSGTVDAMLDDLSVVDYKTGRRTPGHHAAYEWQVRLYAAAVRALTGQMPPAGWLCYVDAERPEDLVSRVDVSPERIDEAIGRAHEAIEHLRQGPPQAREEDVG